ncbi:MAG: DUF3987 domain-containing protein [Bacteroidaceae bacterium]|nr:DUF3987 domain-containing protein [Bacteroidaceae bacterium]
MKIDIYQNKRSVRPFTSWKSRADMLNFLEENKKIAAICQKIKETGDLSLKDGLPAMMPMGDVGDLQRKKENCMPTGIVMIDLDNKGEIGPEVVHWWEDDDPKALIEKMLTERLTGVGQPELERMHVVLVHITPSGKGLRLLVHCHAEGMEATILNCVEALDLKRFGEVDPACTDLSRLSYLVPETYIVYEKGLFDEVPAISIEAMKVWKSTGTAEKHKNTLTDVADVLKNDEEYRDFEYNGHKVAELVREYLDATGGDPPEGLRHPTYNNLIVQFRNLVNNDPKILHAVLPTFGNSIEETWGQCVSLCSSNRTTRLERNVYFFLKDRGYLLERPSPETPEPLEPEEDTLPPMPKLPPVFRQFVNAAPDDFKIPTVVALLPILGTLTSYLRADYFDGKEQSTEFISLLFAPPSSGKSFIEKFSWLLDNIRERDRINNKREEIYAAMDSKKSDNERGEDAPKVSVRIVKPLISIPELLTKMRDNHGNHMLIIAEELDTFSKGNRTTGGDKSDLWRVTWDNGFYGQYYKSTKTFKGEVQMFLNLLFTSTQDQIDRFFKNVEDGLVTRFSVCPIENQMYRSYIPWKKIAQKDILQIKNILTRLDSKVYKLPLKLDFEELDDIKSEEFDAVVPWQFDFLPHEKLDLSYLFPTLYEWLEEERVKSAITLNPARDVFRRRAALKGFRLALVCHGLYTTVGKKEQELIKDFVKWFCSVDLRNSLYQFGERYNELQNKAVAKKIPQSKVFDKLDEVFETTDVRLALQKAGKKTPVKVVISLWKTNGLIESTENNKFKKLKKA